ncbi:YitT family protein [Dyadobacter sediminis]|uniref:YitT family protein n=1 Tax=Dyadobacter sediminis TaxID=1493691 RepID=A0A5R9KBN3_9BACT|nr:YitT family protein [Dyadobacter sediminis]TLU92231.1 YitT family protein [Dyadobacter sediminis]GGB96339.1 membrane protein [Dyadobacter sediminis]
MYSKSKTPFNLSNEIRNAVLILLGILSASMGLKGFLLSSHFIDGGVTGISMLLTHIFGIPLPYLLIVINLPFIIMGYRFMGQAFAIKSALAIIGLSVCLATITFPDITPDKLLTAIFGGVFIGVGIGLAMRGGAVLDGTEIAAMLVSKSTQILKVSDVILILNIIIFAAAAFFLGIEVALYSILTYFAAAKMIDFLLHGIEQYTGVTIISEKSENIRQVITEKLGRGATIYQGKRGYGKRGDRNINMDIIFTVVTRLEIPQLRKEIKLLDAQAFIIQHSIDDTEGGMIKKRPLH